MIIWLASYPKSGNTWVRAFIVSYYFTSDGVFRFEDLSRIPDYPHKNFLDKTVDVKLLKEGDIYKHWDKSQKRILENKKAKFLKTHNSLKPVNEVPFTNKDYTLGVIHIIRDPRNVITSIKNHFSFRDYKDALKYMQTDGAFMKGDDNARYAIIDSWKTHFTSWMTNQSLKRITVRYEDLEKQPEKEFAKIVNFINTILRIKEGIKTDKLMNALNSTKFETLKKGEEEGKFNENVIKDNKKIKFFYKGPQNNWKKMLPKDIQTEMNIFYREDLKNLGYDV
tara:strand:+ start:52 stop:891 length:840 start_codon:yes stop_codon:yes gene_type:complete